MKTQKNSETTLRMHRDWLRVQIEELHEENKNMWELRQESLRDNWKLQQENATLKATVEALQVASMVWDDSSTETYRSLKVFKERMEKLLWPEGVSIGMKF